MVISHGYQAGRHSHGARARDGFTPSGSTAPVSRRKTPFGGIRGPKTQRLQTDDGGAGGARRAVEECETRRRVAWNLPVAGGAAQLVDELVQLPQPDAPIGSPLAIKPPSVLTGIRTADLGRAVGDELLLVAVGAESGLAMWITSAPASVS